VSYVTPFETVHVLTTSPGKLDAGNSRGHGEHRSGINLAAALARETVSEGNSDMFRKIAPVISVVFVVAAIAAIAWSGMKSPQMLDAARLTADLETTGRVRTAFARSTRLSVYDVGVESSKGLVTLSGTLPRESDRELAESVARDVDGVSQIDNRIEVDPGTRPAEVLVSEAARIADLELRTAVREHLGLDENLRGTKVSVGVKDRVVKLSGTVWSEEQREAVARIAEQVEGVKSVDDQLVIGAISN